ncbi:hypothetical protein H6504_00975 [Candidatus Woesearchaeota archaeon]|nr:hypothetical protein [Candidatus Woesearchaeota archaeon]
MTYSIFRRAKPQKRGIMGIGTLIIFIATILVAAVAAAVLISTSNVLQQRSLLVGQEARKTITDGVDIFSIMADSNYTTEQFNNFEILMRLSPGSDPLQMRRFDVELLSNRVHSAAQLYYPGDDNYIDVNASTFTTSQVSIGADLDEDGTDDYMMIMDGAVVDVVVFNLSSEGISENISLGTAVTGGGAIDVEETPITVGEDIYGSIEISGLGSNVNEFDGDIVVIRRVASECSFDFLPPEDYYCMDVVIGNSDYILDSREKVKLLIKTRSNHALQTGEDVMFIMSSEKGRLVEARARAPDVVTYVKTRIWPLD